MLSIAYNIFLFDSRLSNSDAEISVSIKRRMIELSSVDGVLIFNSDTGSPIGFGKTV